MNFREEEKVPTLKVVEVFGNGIKWNRLLLNTFGQWACCIQDGIQNWAAFKGKKQTFSIDQSNYTILFYFKLDVTLLGKQKSSNKQNG